MNDTLILSKSLLCVENLSIDNVFFSQWKDLQTSVFWEFFGWVSTYRKDSFIPCVQTDKRDAF